MEVSGYFMIFLKAFKQNFKQSTLIWILMAAVAVFLYMEKESLVTMPGSMPQIFKLRDSDGMYSADCHCTVHIPDSCSI